MNGLAVIFILSVVFGFSLSDALVCVPNSQFKIDCNICRCHSTGRYYSCSDYECPQKELKENYYDSDRLKEHSNIDYRFGGDDDNADEGTDAFNAELNELEKDTNDIDDSQESREVEDDETESNDLTSDDEDTDINGDNNELNEDEDDFNNLRSEVWDRVLERR